MADTRATPSDLGHRNLGPDLRAAIERAGYYPTLVADTFEAALAGDTVEDYVVHQETTFDSDEIRRHVTVLALTPSRLVVGHTDDHAEGGSPTTHATTSTEALPLDAVRSVVVTRVVAHPERYRAGEPPQEVTLTVAWGAVSRLDLEPATCGDPQCEADHGFTGTVTADDLALRVSAAAEGGEAVERTLSFARSLTAATANRGR
jgi:hypothetical protein